MCDLSIRQLDKRLKCCLKCFFIHFLILRSTDFKFLIQIFCPFFSGFAGGVAREPPHQDGVPQGGWLRLHHLPAGGHGALAVPAAPAGLGPRQPEPGLRAAAHRLLHAHRRHALRARQLTLLPHGDPVREAGRCCEVKKKDLFFSLAFAYIDGVLKI